MAGLGSVSQEDWGGGIFRGRNAPSGSVYDAVNLLVNDERELFKRGGSTYRTTADAAATLVGLADVALVTGPATLLWTAAKYYRVDEGTGGLTDLGLVTDFPQAFARGTGVGGSWILPTTTPARLIAYNGVGPPVSLTYASITTLEYVTGVGSPPRLVVTSGNRAYFSDPGDPTTVVSTIYHELPANAYIVGADSIHNTLVLFTTVGVWAVSNMDLDPVDDQGNVQHQVAQISKDVILWGDPGVAGWAGSLLVPAVDDVYLMGLEATPTPISAAIRPLYRGYVKAGYKPGIATVHRGHYYLPVLDASNNIIDVLVCRLDDGRFAWTRWAGHAAGGAYAVRVGAATRQPKLYGISGLRATELSDTFNVPGTATDADGSTPTFTVETQDYLVGNGMRDSYVDRVRVEYEMAGTTPTVDVAWASGAEGAAYTTLTVARGGGASDGSDYSAWPVRKSRDRIRFRISSTSAVTKLILRRLEVLIRASGRE